MMNGNTTRICLSRDSKKWMNLKESKLKMSKNKKNPKN
jgi:hypothetical protein